MPDVYRPKVILSIDERTMENSMNGPLVVIKEDRRMVLGSRQANFNIEGLIQYGYLIKDHACDNLCISYDRIGTSKIFEIDFTRLQGLDRIDTLQLSGFGKFPPAYDTRAMLAPLRHIKALITDYLAFGHSVFDLFPKLETWGNYSWKSNSIRAGTNARHLRNLHIDGLKGDLSPLEAADLVKLVLIRPTMKTLESVTLFPNLRALCISAPRTLLDVSVLTRLPKLEFLKVETKKEHEGWAEFRSDRLKDLRATIVPSLDILEHFPNLQNYGFHHVVDERNQSRIKFRDPASFDPCLTPFELKAP